MRWRGSALRVRGSSHSCEGVSYSNKKRVRYSEKRPNSVRCYSHDNISFISQSTEKLGQTQSSPGLGALLEAAQGMHTAWLCGRVRPIRLYETID